MLDFVMAIVVFLIVYGFIVSEKANKVAIGIIGATSVILLKLISQEQAVDYINFNTIGLLLGMMLIVGVLRKTGIFDYIAIKTAKISRGDPWKILVILSLITAISSAFLDNVTVILLVLPITLVITKTLQLDPKPFVISQLMLSNVGGAATMIGDPPNLMIGSATSLSFLDFIINLSIPVIITAAVFILIYRLLFKNSFTVTKENQEKLLSMDEKLAIPNKRLLIKSLVVLFITLVGFWIAEYIHVELATIALFGAGVMFIVTFTDVEEIFHTVEWTTLAFFAALFVLVGALEAVGVIDSLAEGMLNLTDGNIMLTAFLVLWIAGIASSFLDNIPFVATMIPLVASLGTLSGVSAAELEPVWWALALGACFGGNGTLIGSSANVIVAGAMEKNGTKIGFLEYMKIGIPLTFISLIISTLYLYVRFFI